MQCAPLDTGSSLIINRIGDSPGTFPVLTSDTGLPPLSQSAHFSVDENLVLDSDSMETFPDVDTEANAVNITAPPISKRPASCAAASAADASCAAAANASGVIASAMCATIEATCGTSFTADSDAYASSAAVNISPTTSWAATNYGHASGVDPTTQCARTRDPDSLDYRLRFQIPYVWELYKHRRCLGLGNHAPNCQECTVTSYVDDDVDVDVCVSRTASCAATALPDASGVAARTLKAGLFDDGGSQSDNNSDNDSGLKTDNEVSPLNHHLSRFRHNSHPKPFHSYFGYS